MKAAVFLPVTMLSVFAFVSITTWADARRREREAFYRSETIKKIAESSRQRRPPCSRPCASRNVASTDDGAKGRESDYNRHRAMF